MFKGIQHFPVLDLKLNHIYLNERKLKNIQKWLNPANLSNFEPLPVHDFGNGRLALTDGHSRAFLAYTMGIQELPIVYDTNDIVISETAEI